MLDQGTLVERSLFGFIIRYSKRDQLRIVPFVLMTMVVYYASLDLPKTIINEAIQGRSFPEGAQTATARTPAANATSTGHRRAYHPTGRAGRKPQPSSAR